MKLSKRSLRLEYLDRAARSIATAPSRHARARRECKDSLVVRNMNKAELVSYKPCPKRMVTRILHAQYAENGKAIGRAIREARKVPNWEL